MNKWLAHFRLGPAGITLATSAMGLVMAGESPYAFPTVLTLIIPLLIYIFGFSDNNLNDIEIDKKNPMKAHFPLVSGSIDVQTIRTINYVGMLTSVVVITLLVSIIGDHVILPILLLYGSIVAGLVYNRFSKVNILAQPLQMIAVGIQPLALYCMFSTEFSIQILLVVVIVTCTIGIGALVGGLKDMIYDPPNQNLAFVFGAKIKEIPNPPDEDVLIVRFGHDVRVAYCTAKAIVIISIATLFFQPGVPSKASMLGFFWILALNLLWLPITLDDRHSTRRDLLSRFAISEFLTYTTSIIALTPYASALTRVLMLIVPVLWLIVVNKLAWGSVKQGFLSNL